MSSNTAGLFKTAKNFEQATLGGRRFKNLVSAYIVTYIVLMSNEFFKRV